MWNYENKSRESQLRSHEVYIDVRGLHYNKGLTGPSAGSKTPPNHIFGDGDATNGVGRRSSLAHPGQRRGSAWCVVGNVMLWVIRLGEPSVWDFTTVQVLRGSRSSQLARGSGLCLRGMEENGRELCSGASLANEQTAKRDQA